MIELIEKANELGWGYIIICVVLFCSLIISAKVLLDKILTTFGLRTEASIKEERLNETMLKMQSDIDRLDRKITENANDTYTKQEQYHQQSINIRNGLIESQDEIKKSLEQLKDNIVNLTQTTNDIQDRNDSKERAKLKDRIAQSYRFYHKEQKWTEMDKEAFKDLIKAYEDAGGSNSFVHSTCEPESQTWEIIDNI